MRSLSCPDDYCDPEKLLKLPFPFPEERLADRIKFDQKVNFHTTDIRGFSDYI